jgi:hypothetical protein
LQLQRLVLPQVPQLLLGLRPLVLQWQWSQRVA